MATVSLVDRVTALEEEVALLNARVQGSVNSGKPWWEQIRGAFAGDPAFKEAMRLGREYRESLRPKPAKRRESK